MHPEVRPQAYELSNPSIPSIFRPADERESIAPSFIGPQAYKAQ